MPDSYEEFRNQGWAVLDPVVYEETNLMAKLVFVAHETSNHEIKDAALKVLDRMLNPRFVTGGSNA